MLHNHQINGNACKNVDQEKFNAAVSVATDLINSYPNLLRYWELGQKINDLFGGKKSDTAIMVKISEKSGLGIDSIRKSKKFQKNYKREQVEGLMETSFRISWHLVANNLRIKNEEFIDLCSSSQSLAELNNAVSEWRKENPTAQGRPANESKNEDKKDEMPNRVDEARNELEELHGRIQRVFPEENEDARDILETLAEIIKKLG